MSGKFHLESWALVLWVIWCLVWRKSSSEIEEWFDLILLYIQYLFGEKEYDYCFWQVSSVTVDWSIVPRNYLLSFVFSWKSSSEIGELLELIVLYRRKEVWCLATLTGSKFHLWLCCVENYLFCQSGTIRFARIWPRYDQTMLWRRLCS